MDRYTSGRVPIEIVEIDQDFCVHTYGESPCTAVLAGGASKCFNTIGTCQDLQNYERGALTLRFSTDQQDQPTTGHYFPFLQRVRIQPGQINPGGGDGGMSPLGKRATISASFSDHPSSDRYVDKYQAERISGVAQASGEGYNPMDRSTFWRKWKARNLYYLHRPMRYISGYIEDGQIVDAVTRHFIVTGFSGPDKNGAVSIEGKDILTLAQREKAQAPIASPGKLLLDIEPEDDEITLDPVGVGDEEYPVSGTAVIGSEVVAFTRSGDTVTLTERGLFTTDVESHGGGDTFQLCWSVSPSRADEILYTLLHDFAGIDDEFLDTDQWGPEVTKFLPLLYSTTVCQPTEVETLLNEMMEQMQFYCWFDERDNKVRIRAVRPADEDPVTELDEHSNLIAGSVRVTDRADQVITRVVVNYGLRNPAVGLDEPSNYAVTDIVVAPEEESEDRSRMRRTKTINSRWLPAGAGAQALALGQRLLARYKVPPRRIEFSMDAKDRDLWLADFALLRTWQVVDRLGNVVPIPVQVMAVQEQEAGTTYSYSAQQFEFEEPVDPDWRPIDVSLDENNINLRDRYNDRYGTPPTDDDVIYVTVRPGVVVGSDTVGEAALEVLNEDWPTGTTIILNVGAGAYIAGAGGRGGDGGGVPSMDGADGEDGGVAIKATRSVTLINNGTIGGGGGGGGGGQRMVLLGSSTWGAGGGGGGAGRMTGAGGEGGQSDVIAVTDGFAGSSGDLSVGGTGGAGAASAGDLERAGAGGKGGDLGEAGSDGGAASTLPAGSYGVGGNPGPAIDGASFIVFETAGTIRGGLIN